jgi:hypothetical protein
MGRDRYLETDFSVMWKKLKLIRILYQNGLRLLSPLYADYIAARKKYIQKLHDVGYLSSGPYTGLIVVDYRVRTNPTNGLTVSLVNLQTSMMALPIN